MGRVWRGRAAAGGSGGSRESQYLQAILKGDRYDIKIPIDITATAAVPPVQVPGTQVY